MKEDDSVIVEDVHLTNDRDSMNQIKSYYSPSFGNCQSMSNASEKEQVNNITIESIMVNPVGSNWKSQLTSPDNIV